MDIKPEVLDELLKGIKTQDDLAGPNGLLKAITKALAEQQPLHIATFEPGRIDSAVSLGTRRKLCSIDACGGYGCSQ